MYFIQIQYIYICTTWCVRDFHIVLIDIILSHFLRRLHNLYNLKMQYYYTHFYRDQLIFMVCRTENHDAQTNQGWSERFNSSWCLCSCTQNEEQNKMNCIVEPSLASQSDRKMKICKSSAQLSGWRLLIECFSLVLCDLLCICDKLFLLWKL